MSGEIGNQKVRDYLFDNIKAILIFLTVFGHALELIVDNMGVNMVSNFIYSFHMPAFIFITGYFSKDTEKCHATAVKRYLVPYFIFTFLLRLQTNYLNGDVEYIVKILKPGFGLWFFLAVFWWKYFLKDIVKIRYILPLSIVFGVLFSFNGEFDSFLSLGRTINFMFFFLLGYYTKKEHIDRIRSMPKVLSILQLLVTVGFAYIFTFSYQLPKNYMFFRDPFVSGESLIEILVRLSIYVIGSGMIFVLFNLCNSKKHWYTYIGANSVSVYVLHLFIIKALEHFWLVNLEISYQFVLLLVISIVITVVTASPWVEWCYQKFISCIVKVIFRG